MGKGGRGFIPVSLFVDTSTWYAAVDADDRSNTRAREVLARGDALITTDHVLVESWFLIWRRVGTDAAEAFWEGLRSGIATIETVGHADLELAWSIGQTFTDQGFSIVDRTSFAVMQRLGVYAVASFDKDFAVYRFGPRRDKAFSVVR